MTDWRTPGENTLSDPATKSLWDSFVSQLGYGTIDDGIQKQLEDQGIFELVIPCSIHLGSLTILK